MTLATMFSLLLTPAITACAPDEAPETPSETPQPEPGPQPEPEPGPPEESRIRLRVGSAAFTVRLRDNAAAVAFLSLLPLTVEMDDLNGNEKYRYLPQPLPTAATVPGTILTGDLMLYGSDCLVLFYESFRTTYRYTPLGRVEQTEGLAEALGRGNVEVVFESE